MVTTLFTTLSTAENQRVLNAATTYVQNNNAGLNFRQSNLLLITMTAVQLHINIISLKRHKCGRHTVTILQQLLSLTYLCRCPLSM